MTHPCENGCNGCDECVDYDDYQPPSKLYTQADLDAAVAKTRDACAQVCESRSRSLSRDDLHVAANEAKKCAGAIRARTTP